MNFKYLLFVWNLDVYKIGSFLFMEVISRFYCRYLYIVLENFGGNFLNGYYLKWVVGVLLYSILL